MNCSVLCRLCRGPYIFPNHSITTDSQLSLAPAYIYYVQLPITNTGAGGLDEEIEVGSESMYQWRCIL